MFRRSVVRHPTVPVIALHLERLKCECVPTVAMDGSHTVCHLWHYLQIGLWAHVRQSIVFYAYDICFVQILNECVTESLYWLNYRKILIINAPFTHVMSVTNMWTAFKHYFYYAFSLIDTSIETSNKTKYVFIYFKNKWLQINSNYWISLQIFLRH